MPIRSTFPVLALTLCGAALHAQGGKAASPKPATLKFNGTEFHLRWAKGGQFEFTPAGQEDLNRWTEMLTLWRYDAIRDGDGLAAQANRTLGAYQNAKGKILRTNSLPRTAQKPAEHFIAALLGSNQFIEFAAARLLLMNGKGVGIVYSRRAYGKPAKPDLGAWVTQNGAAIEQKLMAFDPGPALAGLPR
jgi:hypothetical protein